MGQTIAIIDYGSGNLRSAAKAVQHCLDETGSGTALITARAEDVRAADRIVLPGQGAFGDCMNGLSSVPGMIEVLLEKVLKTGTPFLGICVGMQLMATRGLEFGEHKGLGWIDGTVRKFDIAAEYKIPHMGWNTVEFADPVHSVLRGITKCAAQDETDFYFVHSFVFECKSEENVAGWCTYGERFPAIVAKDTMIGTQFHPEKSQKAGLELIRGFLQWRP